MNDKMNANGLSNSSSVVSVRSDHVTKRAIKQSSVNGTLNVHVDPKVEDKSLEEYGVETTTKPDDRNIPTTKDDKSNNVTPPPSFFTRIIEEILNFPASVVDAICKFFHLAEAETVSPEKAKGKPAEGEVKPTKGEESTEVAERKPVEETKSAAAKTASPAKAKIALCQYFRKSDNNFREFNFEKFAEVNEVAVEGEYIPHSDIVKNGFRLMYDVVDELLDGVTFKKEDGENIPINLTPNEVLGIINTLGNIPDEDKAYKLYGELGALVFSKMNSAVQNTNKETLEESSWANYYICKSILSLPLVNCAEGIDVCKEMIDSILTGAYSIFELSEQQPTDEERENENHKTLVDSFKALGMFFAFKNDKLGKELLPAAQFATSIGMKMPLFMAEMTTSKTSETFGLSDDIVGVVIRDTAISRKDDKGFPLVNHVFYHEVTHHAKSAVGALFADKSIARQNLEREVQGLKNNTNLINAIKSQISEYALTNSEEYIAEFSALVLCCLEHNKNPFNYIDDTRLWRLYYEFGGPDYAPIIHEKFYKSAGVHNVLENPNYGYCSGYPSKFGVDVNLIKDQQVEVEGMTSIGRRSFVKIDEKTILPPPPLGYCYEVKDGKLQLKDLASGKYHNPTFCSLTDGPLTLMKTEPVLVHHFELFPKRKQ